MPILNTNLGFKLSRDLDNITIEKIGVREIVVELFYRETCKTYTLLSDKIEVEDVISLRVPTKDGVYKLRITSTDEETEEFEYKDFLFNNYNLLLRSIISGVEKYVTNCSNCPECNDCVESNTSIESTLLSKLFSFYILNREYYSKFFNSGLSCIECAILDSTNCHTLSEFLSGKEGQSNLNKQMISYLFYIFYLGEKAVFTCCPESIDKKFKINKIKKYLDKNINVDCVEAAVVSDPDYFMSDSNFVEL